MIDTNMYEYENALHEVGITVIAGVDEVGRGPLFGPVVAACVVLPVDFKCDLINDSKKLTHKKRLEAYKIIMENALSVSISVVGEEVIDEINILEASKLAMINAINDSTVNIEHVLIDACKLDIFIPSTSIIKGDAKSITIASASIIAKITRDEMMDRTHEMYPMYGFDKHKGYPTKKHLEAISKYGIIEGYRKSFKPIKELIKE